MSNSGNVWDTREAYKQIRANTWSLGSRGLFMGGSAPSASNVIDYIDLNHAGNAVDFGDLAVAGAGTQASNSIRAIHSNLVDKTSIDYVTMTTKGNAADFGNMLDGYGADAAAANDTRACYVGGYEAPTFSPGWNINRIEYVNIPTLGNMVDFGDLTQGRANQGAGSNGTRGIFAGGYNGGTVSNTDYITMATTGNATDFGDSTAGFAPLSANSPIRLYCAGGQPGNTNIGYFTFSTLGNSTEWGNLPVKGAQGAGSASHTRGIFQMGEAASPLGAASNRLESISMISSGDSTDFGDLTVGRQDTYCVAAQGHGGLQLGFEPRPSVTYMPGSGRILSNGGNAPHGGTIEYTNISTLGNGVDFGDSAGGATRALCGATSNMTRAMFMGGDTPSKTNLVDAVEFASRGNSFDFGNLTATVGTSQGCASTTRAINAGGVSGSYSNIIEYASFATAGDFTDFGDLISTTGGPAGASSPVRGLFMGGYTPSASDKIDYITIASTGNALDFGNLTTTIVYAAGGASSTRALRMGGATVNVIDYVTTASTGNATDFGDLTVARGSLGGGSSNTRSIALGGAAPSESNVMDYVTIASTGNAADFGDMYVTRGYFSSASDSHGGLQSS